MQAKISTTTEYRIVTKKVGNKLFYETSTVNILRAKKHKDKQKQRAMKDLRSDGRYEPTTSDGGPSSRNPPPPRPPKRPPPLKPPPPRPPPLPPKPPSRPPLKPPPPLGGRILLLLLCSNEGAFTERRLAAICRVGFLGFYVCGFALKYSDTMPIMFFLWLSYLKFYYKN